MKAKSCHENLWSHFLMTTFKKKIQKETKIKTHFYGNHKYVLFTWMHHSQRTTRRETNNFKVSLVFYKPLVLSTTGTISSISWSSTSKIKARQKNSACHNWINRTNKQSCAAKAIWKQAEGRKWRRGSEPGDMYGPNHGEWQETKLIRTKSSCPQLNLLSTAVHCD